MPDFAPDERITNYWESYYIDHDSVLCSLCGNSGVIDTRGAKSAAGVVSGRRNWCICPNGQALRHFSSKVLP